MKTFWKKKGFGVGVALLLVCALSLTAQAQAGSLGDLNGDGLTDTQDAVLLYQYAAGSRMLTEPQLAVSDILPNGRVDMADAQALFQYAAGLTADLGGNAARPTAPSTDGQVVASGMVVTVNDNYAETFTGGTTDDYSKPMNAYLPPGTQDVTTGAFTNEEGKSYFSLHSGRRVYVKDAAATAASADLIANGMTVAETAVDEQFTTLFIASGWKVPYTVRLWPQEYTTEDQPRPRYDVDAFTAQYVDVEFAYTTVIAGAVDVSGSPLFDRGEWAWDGGRGAYTLRLHLRQQGSFYGYGARWENGELKLEFRHRHTVTDNLSGLSILLDPGHGGEDPGAVSGGVYEKDINLSIALKLRDDLRARGATVYMTRASDVEVFSSDIERLTRQLNPDLVVSVHANAYESGQADGPSLHYFNPYAAQPAREIYAGIREVYLRFRNDSTYRTPRWDPFRVTRPSECPSVLIETGFVTDPADAWLLTQENFQNQLAAAIAGGVQSYFCLR